jgi:hypothetical protein
MLEMISVILIPPPSVLINGDFILVIGIHLSGLKAQPTHSRIWTYTEIDHFKISFIDGCQKF